MHYGANKYYYTEKGIFCYLIITLILKWKLKMIYTMKLTTLKI